MCQGAQQTFPHLLGVLFHPETALRIEVSIPPLPVPPLVEMKNLRIRAVKQLVCHTAM